MTDPMDIERRARELEITPDGLSCGTYLHVEPWMSSFVAIALAREAQQAKAEEIAQDCEKVLDQDYRGGPRLLCAGLDAAVTIARSHAIPPQPAPETREAKLEKALRALRERLQDYEFPPQAMVEEIDRALETRP